MFSVFYEGVGGLRYSAKVLRLTYNFDFMKIVKNKFIPFEKYLIDSGLFSELEIDYLCSLSGKFGYSLDSRNRIARFLYFISAMPSFLFDSTLMFMPKLESFFCTQDFVNLAWFKYWDNPNNSGFYPRDKKIEIDFIRKVFGSDFGVASNW